MRHTGEVEGKPHTITYRNGRTREIPRIKIGEEPVPNTGGKEKRSVFACMFGVEARCPRCGGHPRKDGQIAGHSGLLRVCRISPAGVWTSFIAACDCTYGAWRASERWDSDQKRCQQHGFADDLRDVPPGLSASQWTHLSVYQAEGDSYRAAACKLPAEMRGPVLTKIDRWLEGNPPTWADKPRDRRCPEDGQRREDVPPPPHEMDQMERAGDILEKMGRESAPDTRSEEGAGHTATQEDLLGE